MKRIINIIFVVLGLTLFLSCERDKGATYTPEAGEGLYTFATSNMGTIEFSKSVPTQILNVYRSTTEGSSSINVTSTQKLIVSSDETVDLEGKDRVVTHPAQINFEDGKSIAEFEVTLTDKMLVGETYSITFNLNESDVIVGGNQTLSFEADQQYTWISLGKYQYYDYYYYSYDADELGIVLQDVELQKADGYNRWKLIKPWDNRELLKERGKHGDQILNDDYEDEWEFYEVGKDDQGRMRLAWDHYRYLGIVREKYLSRDHNEKKSTMYYKYDDEDYGFPSYYNESAQIFELWPVTRCGYSTYHQKYGVLIAKPGIDIKKYITDHGYDHTRSK